MKKKLAAVSLGVCALAASAQAPSIDHLTTQELLARAEALKAKAEAGGSASITLSEYPNHHTMLAYRTKSGSAEVHDAFSDLFFILRGHATLLSGGTVVDPASIGPGETSGTALHQAKSTELNPGDFIHISAGVPHQLTLSPGQDFVYYVVKVREK